MVLVIGSQDYYLLVALPNCLDAKVNEFQEILRNPSFYKSHAMQSFLQHL